MAVACRPAPAELVPAGAQPVSMQQVTRWVEATEPTGHRIHRFKWLFRDERSSAGGRGSARIAAPDSLRFDVAGPFGAGAASAAVIGDSTLWARPEDAIERLVPSYPLMWAMFGVARLPSGEATLRGLESATTTSWQYIEGADTVEYVRTGGDSPRLTAEVRHSGKVLGRTETALTPDGLPRTARLIVPSVPARLDITFDSTAKTPRFSPGIWIPRGR